MLQWNKILHNFNFSNIVRITSLNLFKTFRYSEDQIKLGKLIFNLVEKKYNYKHISNYLNLNGYRTSRGKKFTPILVSMFLYKLKKRLIGYLELEIIPLSKIEKKKLIAENFKI